MLRRCPCLPSVEQVLLLAKKDGRNLDEKALWIMSERDTVGCRRSGRPCPTTRLVRVASGVFDVAGAGEGPVPRAGPAVGRS